MALFIIRGVDDDNDDDWEPQDQGPDPTDGAGSTLLKVLERSGEGSYLDCIRRRSRAFLPLSKARAPSGG